MDKARNEMLTRVGPGTPMGELLRRSGIRSPARAELLENPIKPMRLMGEDPFSTRNFDGVWIARPAFAAPSIWLRGKGRHSLQLPWLADG